MALTQGSYFPRDIWLAITAPVEAPGWLPTAFLTDSLLFKLPIKTGDNAQVARNNIPCIQKPHNPSKQHRWRRVARKQEWLSLPHRWDSNTQRWSKMPKATKSVCETAKRWTQRTWVPVLTQGPAFVSIEEYPPKLQRRHRFPEIATYSSKTKQRTKSNYCNIPPLTHWGENSERYYGKTKTNSTDFEQESVSVITKDQHPSCALEKIHLKRWIIHHVQENKRLNSWNSHSQLTRQAEEGGPDRRHCFKGLGSICRCSDSSFSL